MKKLSNRINLDKADKLDKNLGIIYVDNDFEFYDVKECKCFVAKCIPLNKDISIKYQNDWYEVEVLEKIIRFVNENEGKIWRV